MRFPTEEAAKFRAGFRELGSDFLQRHAVKVILPADMIVTVNADLKSRCAHRANRHLVAPAHVRSREQRSVEQGPHAVEFDDARAADLGKKTRPENPLDRLAGIVRPEAEKETARRTELSAIFYKIAHAKARATVGVDIDL